MSTKKVLSPKNSSRGVELKSPLHKILNNKDCGAFVVRGSRQEILFEVRSTNDYEESIFCDVSTLGIDDVKSKVSQTDFSVEGSRLVVFSFYNITLEAQSALLKFLEEPPKNTTIFLITGKSTVLLPTVLSRVGICHFSGQTSISENTKHFLETEPVLRMNLTFIKKMLLAKTDNSETIDKEAIHDFIDSVLEISAQDDVNKITSMEREMLQNSLSLVSRLKQNGASAKQILEYVSLACRQR